MISLNPKISIITPCYNASVYLGMCIESVIAQTFVDWEMIIVDDCSTDNSADIIKAYQQNDSRIKYFKTPYPSGSPAQPRNIGIGEAKGRYLAFLDADDIWLPQKLEEQIKCIELHKSCMVFSNYEKIDNAGNKSHRIITAPSVVTLKDMYCGNPIGCLTAFVDSSIVGKFQFRNMHHEDCIAWIEIIREFGNAYNTNTVNAYYRESEQSVSRNKLKILGWQWKIYREILHFGIFKSIYYYIQYAYRGLKKVLI